MRNGFAKNARRARQWDEVDQVELARRTGLNGKTISDIELGRRRPSLEQALAIAKGLGRSLDKLCGYEPEQKKEEE